MEKVADKATYTLSPKRQRVREQMLEMWNNGISLKEIGESISRSPSTVGATVHRLRNSGEVNFERRNFLTETLEYDIYKGDTYVYSGTAKEVSEHFGVKIATVRYWASPKHHERCEVGSRKGYIAYRYTDEEL